MLEVFGTTKVFTQKDAFTNVSGCCSILMWGLRSYGDIVEVRPNPDAPTYPKHYQIANKYATLILGEVTQTSCEVVQTSGEVKTDTFAV
jgi:hypothetical protein